MKQANIKKGKGKEKKDKETKKMNVFQKWVDGQKAKKNGVLKGKTKGKPENKTELEEKKDFKDRPFGDTRTLKL